MILEKLDSCLIEKGFKRFRVNVGNICVYFKDMLQESYLLSIYKVSSGQEFTKEQFCNIQSQIYNSVHNPNQTVHFLTIIVTDRIENAREMSGMNNNVWYLDITKYRLIIYENHTDDFLGLQKDIDNIIYEIKKENLGYHTNSDIGPDNTSTFGNHGTTSDNKTFSQDVRSKDTGNFSSAGNHDDRYEPYSQGRDFSQWTNGTRYIFTITNLLILINALVFFIMEIQGSTNDLYYVLDKGALYWPAIKFYHEYYRFFTYMFLHFGLDHLVNNMLVLFFIGGKLERIVGKAKFLCIYFSTGLLAGIASLGYNMLKNNNIVSAGASGAIFGVVGAMAYIVLLHKGKIKDISTRQIVLFVLLSLYGGLTSQGIDNIAHIGGLLSGFILAAVLYKKQKRNFERG
jgi:rhomboid protease GluP